MNRDSFLQRLAEQRVVPVIRVGRPGLAEQAARWCRDEGLSLVEITLTCPDALQAVARLSEEPDLTVGVGTVLSRGDAAAAVAAGAAFLVTPMGVPGLSGAVLPVPLVAGAATPTEVLVQHQGGAAAAKIFPAGSLGGPGFLKSLRQVLPEVPLLPTGGVTVDNAGDYLAAGALAVGLGSDLLGAELLEAQDRAGFAARLRRLRAALGAA